MKLAGKLPPLKVNIATGKSARDKKRRSRPRTKSDHGRDIVIQRSL